ncbi:MAG: hypothetical protein QOC66_1906 [Pseudonocardiales bacterium]|jgi:hypothetical protein|nr:hypothetical protein [Pseudonocardiales bacterium]
MSLIGDQGAGAAGRGGHHLPPAHGQFLELADRMGAERLAEALSAMRALSQAVDSLSERH